MNLLANISAAVRRALGKPILSAIQQRAHQAIAKTEAEKQREADAKLPQPLRLWLIARRKRTCAKRRMGDSAKSPAANRAPGGMRRARATGLGTYAERDQRVSELLSKGVSNASRIASKELS